jgi:hypothetical protein
MHCLAFNLSRILSKTNETSTVTKVQIRPDAVADILWICDLGILPILLFLHKAASRYSGKTKRCKLYRPQAECRAARPGRRSSRVAIYYNCGPNEQPGGIRLKPKTQTQARVRYLQSEHWNFSATRSGCTTGSPTNSSLSTASLLP